MLPNIFVEGNLTDEPELRFTPAGKAMVTFTVVSSDRRRNDAGEWEDVDTTFFNCIAWGAVAENVAESFNKGSRAIVFGKIHQRTWQNDEGENRRSWQVKVNEVGPSLRYAQAEVKKIKRDTTQAQGEPWAGASKVPANAGNQDPWAAFGGQADDPPF